MVRIKFINDKDNAKGLCELVKRVKVICLPDDIYEVGEKSLKILDDLNIKYKILQREGFDYAYATIRNSITAKI